MISSRFYTDIMIQQLVMQIFEISSSDLLDAQAFVESHPYAGSVIMSGCKDCSDACASACNGCSANCSGSSR